MGYCSVPQCNHQNKTHSCKLFTFPKDPSLKRKWAKLIRRAKPSPRKLHLASPQKNSRVCSCHFKDGKRSALPTILPWSVNKRLNVSSPEKKRRQKPCVVRSLNFEDGLHEENSRVEHMDDTNRPDAYMNKTLDKVQSLPNDNHPSVLDSNLISSSAEAQSLKTLDQVQPLLIGDHPSVANSILISSLPEAHGENTVPVQTAFLTSASKTDVSTMTDIDQRYQDVLEENVILQKKIEDLDQKLKEATSVVHAAENTLLKSEVAKLKDEVRKNGEVFLFKSIEDKDQLVAHFTGLPNRQTFRALLRLFDAIDIQYVKKWRVARLNREEQLFLTLLKLRRGCSDLDLASRFKVEKTTVANVFLTWLMALHHVIVKNLLMHVPSRVKNRQHLPKCFELFPNTRIILDATEFASANPTLLSNQSKMFSSYKHRITVKGLVGIAPDGTVTLASELFAGSTSDRNAVIASGILTKLVPGDSIMADKGFNIEDLLPDGVTLNIPPFKDAPQFTAEQVNETFEVATARIHVERAINRIKRFQILDFIPETVAAYGSEIFQVCAALTNFQRPLIKHVDEEI